LDLSRCPSLVRSSLEYACSSWDSYNKGEIDQLERAQRRAARFLSNRQAKLEDTKVQLEDTKGEIRRYKGATRRYKGAIRRYKRRN
jgi:hypothetical protein